MLKSRYGIQTSKMHTKTDVKNICTILQRINYNGQSPKIIEEWKQDNLTNKGWSEEVSKRLEMLFKK
jgi:hypothetical protein